MKLPMFIRYKRLAVDKKRSDLAELEVQRVSLYRQFNQIYEHVHEEKKKATNDPMSQIWWKGYYHGMLKKMEHLRSEIQQLESQMHPLQDDLSEMFKEVKALEIIEQERQKQKQYKKEKDQQDEIDEFAQNLHQKGITDA